MENVERKVKRFQIFSQILNTLNLEFRSVNSTLFGVEFSHLVESPWIEAINWEQLHRLLWILLLNLFDL